MKKIGFVNFDMSVRGGAQQVLYNMALALRKEYEITIISFIQENEACAYELPEDIHYEVLLPYKARIREVITKAGKPFRSFIKKTELDIVFYRSLCRALRRNSWKTIKDSENFLRSRSSVKSME